MLVKFETSQRIYITRKESLKGEWFFEYSTIYRITSLINNFPELPIRIVPISLVLARAIIGERTNNETDGMIEVEMK